MKISPWACAAALFCATPLAAEAAEFVCPALQIEGQLQPPLSDAEKRLVCGDPQPTVSDSDAWRSIPPAQGRFHLRAFLQTRGYLHPVFVEKEEGNILLPGQPTRVSSLRANGAPPELYLERKRKVVGEKLTPDLLSSVEKWVLQRLQAEGYPCPDIKAEGNPETGAITVEISAGAKRTFPAIINQKIPGMDEGILRRYDAFRTGWTYDGDALNLSENRIVSLGVVQSLHYETLCDPEKKSQSGEVPIRERIVAGPSRLLNAGFGLNTETGIVARGGWSNNRLGAKASQISANAYASSKLQRLELGGRYYFLDGPARFHLRPHLQFQHQNEIYFETLSFRADATPSTTRDLRAWGAVFNFGPTLELIRTLRGPGVGDSHFTSLFGEMIWRTHDFEYYAANPKSGANLTARVALSDQNILSSISAQRLSFYAESLWNIKQLDPPLWILGARLGLQTTLTPERTGSGTLLPAEFIYYLGGSANLRGYGRQELPDPDGGLTTVFLNFEARLANELPLGFEPIVFWDMGAIGKRPTSLETQVFHSPGFGVRWNSPVGVFRSTLAHGLTSTATVTAHWQFFLSYGEEF